MRKKILNIPNLLFLILLVLIFLPSKNQDSSPIAFLVVVILTEASFLFVLFRNKYKKSILDIITIVFVILILWEVLSTKLAIANPILFPPPENVFYVFITTGKMMWDGFVNSMELMFIGLSLALIFGIGLGLLIGWFPRLRETIFPIVKVISPIPALVYTPYLVGIMPSFRSASILVIFLGVFWPNLMTMIVFVGGVDRKIIDSAKSLNVKTSTMLYKIILPYAIPSIIDGLSLCITFSFMTLTFAETIGSTSGLGYYVKKFADYGNYTNVLAGIILIGIVVTILNVLVNILKKKVVKWV